MSFLLRAQVVLAIFFALCILIAYAGLSFMLMVSKGIVSSDDQLVSFMMMLTVPMLAILLFLFLYSSIFLGYCIYLNLVRGEFSSILKKLFVVHSIYEMSYVVFYLILFGKKWG